MAHRYVGVQWNGFKIGYDLFLIAFMLVFSLVFVLVTPMSQPDGSSFHPVQFVIRLTGALAFTMLTAILLIGPLARLTPRALPLLYNRRHFGVLTFLVALVHGGLVLMWYHGFSTIHPLVSLFTSDGRYASLSGYPFQTLGAFALIILFFMAATSHDFWNRHLGPVWWKSLHMGVYLAYGLLVGHIALGKLQANTHMLALSLLVVSIALVAMAHIGAHFKKPAHQYDARPTLMDDRKWLKVGPIGAMREGRAQIVRPPIGNAIAVFRVEGVVQGVSHLCPHQGGPLGEGKVLDGCITCPWHGFQFQLMDGRSPAPYDEQIATYQTRIEDGVVFVALKPSPDDKPASPTMIGSAETPHEAARDTPEGSS